MGRLAQAIGSEETITHGGREYKLSPLTVEVMALFEEWLEDRAWQKLERRQKQMLPENFAAARKELRESIDAGEYGFFSQVGARAMSPENFLGPGFRQLLSIRLKIVNPGVTDDLVWEIVEANFEKLLELTMGMDHVPNSPTPEQPGAELSSAGKPSSPSSPASPGT